MYILAQSVYSLSKAQSCSTFTLLPNSRLSQTIFYFHFFSLANRNMQNTLHDIMVGNLSWGGCDHYGLAIALHDRITLLLDQVARSVISGHSSRSTYHQPWLPAPILSRSSDFDTLLSTVRLLFS